MADCLSILPDGTCRHHKGSKCLINDSVIRGYFGNMNVCVPVSEATGIKQLHGKEADEWLKNLSK